MHTQASAIALQSEAQSKALTAVMNKATYDKVKFVGSLPETARATTGACAAERASPRGPALGRVASGGLRNFFAPTPAGYTRT